MWKLTLKRLCCMSEVSQLVSALESQLGPRLQSFWFKAWVWPLRGLCFLTLAWYTHSLLFIWTVLLLFTAVCVVRQGAGDHVSMLGNAVLLLEASVCISPRHGFCIWGLCYSGFLLCTLAHQKTVGLRHRGVGNLCQITWDMRGCFVDATPILGFPLSCRSHFPLHSAFWIDLL